MEIEQVKDSVKAYILEEFLPGENPEALDDSTPLVSGGILDSLATLKLVAFIEERYGVELEPHELDTEHLDSIPAITKLILSKKNA